MFQKLRSLFTNPCPRCHRPRWSCECGFVGTTAAIIGAAAISAGTSIASGVIGGKAAKKAGRVQARGSERAAELQERHAREALKFNREIWQGQQQNLQPYMEIGRTGLANLGHLMGLPSQYQEPQAQAPPMRSPAAAPFSPEEFFDSRRRGAGIGAMMQQRRM